MEGFHGEISHLPAAVTIEDRSIVAINAL